MGTYFADSLDNLAGGREEDGLADVVQTIGFSVTFWNLNLSSFWRIKRNKSRLL